jgi:hypothetical protein
MLGFIGGRKGEEMGKAKGNFSGEQKQRWKGWLDRAHIFISGWPHALSSVDAHTL